MKRRSRAAIAGTPNVGDALFVNAGGSDAEWSSTVTAGVASRRTWSADATIVKAAQLAARCVRVSARPSDDGKYAKYTPSGFVLARADEGVAISNGNAQQGALGRTGAQPAGARGSTNDGALGSGANAGAVGATTQGRQGDVGTSAQGSLGQQGRVEVGLQGNLGATGPTRAALTQQVLADLSLSSGTGLFAARAAGGGMPTFQAITATEYTHTATATLVSYGVASEAQSLSWDVHVRVGAAYVLVDQRSSQACPSATYREYALAATPPQSDQVRITFTGITVGGGSSTALVSLLTL
jgi:hypothetical protein